MLINIMFIVFIIGLSIYFYKELESLPIGIFLGVLCGFLISLVLTFLTMGIIDSSAIKENIVLSDVQLCALQDNNSVQGNFFLGSGNIDGSMKYIYLTKTEDGGYLMGSVNATDAIVHEIDSKPHITKYTQKYKNSDITYWFGDPMFSNVKSQIFVPNGSIKYNFNINLK